MIFATDSSQMNRANAFGNNVTFEAPPFMLNLFFQMRLLRLNENIIEILIFLK
jgi:hypothetical protein